MKYLSLKDIQEIIENCHSDLVALKGQKILLTGAAGFLGRYFTSVFSEFNKQSDEKIAIVGLDNHISSGEFGVWLGNSKIENFEFHKVNLITLDEQELIRLADASLVVHAAGIASPQHYKANPLETVDVAVLGTRRLLNICEATKAKFCFFSSSEIYGNPPIEEMPIREEYKGNVSSTGPRACYDESKRLGETLCSIYSKESNVHTNIIRPFNVYGPGMQSTDFRVMPNFAFRVKKNEPLQVYGTGNQTRTYCYVSDAIAGFVKIFARGKYSEAYNIGNPNDEISAFDLAKKFSDYLDLENKIEIINHPNEYPSDEPERRCPDISKARKDLDYVPKINLDSGINRFMNFILD